MERWSTNYLVYTQIQSVERLSQLDCTRPSNHSLLIAAIVIAVLIRFPLWLYIEATNPLRFLQPDSKEYFNSALSLMNHGVFKTNPDGLGLAETGITPGYPAFLAAIFYIFGNRPSIGVFIQLIISIFTILILYRISVLIHLEKIGGIAAIIFASDPATLYQNMTLATETLFTFVLLLIILVGIKLFREENVIWAIILGILYAWAILIRPIFYYMPLFILTGILIWGRLKKIKFSKIVMLSLLFIIPCMVIVGGWQYRNLKAVGNLDISRTKGINLYYYRAAGVIAHRDRISIDEARKRLTEIVDNKKTDAKQNDELVRRGMAIIRENPLTYLYIHLKGMLIELIEPGSIRLAVLLGLHQEGSGLLGKVMTNSFVKFFNYLIDKHKILVAFAIPGMMFLALMYSGCLFAFIHWRVWFPTDTCVHLLMIGTALYLLFISGGPEAYSRFRVPYTPILALYAGIGLNLFIESRESRGKQLEKYNLSAVGKSEQA